MSYLYNLFSWITGPAQPAAAAPKPAQAALAKDEANSHIAMPSLSCENLDNLEERLRDMPSALADELDSQGFYSDGTSAYSHESTYSLASFQIEGYPKRINMDRGGFVKRPDGTYHAIICDGVGGAGPFSAFTAAMLSRFILRTLYEHPLNFRGGQHDQAKALLREAAHFLQSTVPQTYQSHGNTGESTASIVSCVPYRENKFVVSVASLGDGAVFHLSRKDKTASQLNEIRREITADGRPKATDTGGSIGSNGEIYALDNLSTHIIVIPKEDFLVLVTDGVLDNIQDDIVHEVIEHVAFSPLFDQPTDTLLSYNRFWDKGREPRLPNLNELQRFIEAHPVAEERALSSEKITNRLANYVKLVTQKAKEQEEAKSHGQPVPSFGIPAAANLRSDEPKTDDTMIITIAPSE